MGFGITSLGYLMIIFDSMGGGLIGWPLMAYGFYRLSAVNNRFRLALILSILSLEYSVVNLLAIFEAVNDQGMFYKVSYGVYLAIGALLHFAIMTGIRQLAKEGGSEKIANTAVNRLYLTEVFYFWAILVMCFPSLNIGTLSMLLLGFRFIIGFMNLWFLYTCFAKITTQSQLEKDKKYFEDLEKQEKAKKRQKTE